MPSDEVPYEGRVNAAGAPAIGKATLHHAMPGVCWDSLDASLLQSPTQAGVNKSR